MIDSVIVEDKNHGLLFFDVTTGQVDVLKEEKLNNQLNFNKKFVFLVDRTDNKFEIATHEPMICSRGDSVYVNTDKNLISIYIQGKQITSEDAISSLRGSHW